MTSVSSRPAHVWALADRLEPSAPSYASQVRSVAALISTSPIEGEHAARLTRQAASLPRPDLLGIIAVVDAARVHLADLIDVTAAGMPGDPPEALLEAARALRAGAGPLSSAVADLTPPPARALTGTGGEPVPWSNLSGLQWRHR